MTLQRYGIRLHQDQLVAPVYDLNRSLVNVVLLTARNAEIILVDSIWDALCIYQTTGKVTIAILNIKFSMRVRTSAKNSCLVSFG